MREEHSAEWRREQCVWRDEAGRDEERRGASKYHATRKDSLTKRVFHHHTAAYHNTTLAHHTTSKHST
ncbi:hypothetical protein E2C01_058462 [Portunus trituberculatus]|uniref:Uncharacterized protein n=1 Tax=Portunus trituberculatus TaxID=210409 RepID=A0A5B7H5G0_PORTR|nr:hypothetical protein [Portunus trituberculatus]